MARLSEIILNQKYYDHLEVALYHGTTTLYLDHFKKNGIQLVNTKKRRDFGTGFYLTTNYLQALEYARKSPASDPMIVCCFISLGDLRAFSKSLLVDDYDQQWLETLVRGRCCDTENPLSADYDWIYGRCGDGKTPVFNQKLRECDNDHEKLIKKIKPRALTPHPELPHFEYDQLWIGSKEVIKKLRNPHIIYTKGVEELEITIPIQQ